MSAKTGAARRIATKYKFRTSETPTGSTNAQNTQEVAGSIPVSGYQLQWPKLTWAEKLGKPGKPYMIRWVLDFNAFSIRLHHWLSSDDLRYPHDHPWDFWSLVLWGTVFEIVSKTITRTRTPGTLTWYPAEYRHSAYIQSSTWTLLLCTPTKRQWGFWVQDKFIQRDQYFKKHGHH